MFEIILIDNYKICFIGKTIRNWDFSFLNERFKGSWRRRKLMILFDKDLLY